MSKHEEQKPMIYPDQKIVDIEMEKAYHVNYDMAEEKAYKAVGYTVIDCPYCSRRDAE